MARVLCIGGCNWDIRMVAKQPLIAGESTPVTAVKTPGGVVTNVANLLRTNGHQVELATVVGNDPPISSLSPLSKRFADQESARYVTVEQPDGSLLYGLADMDMYAAMDKQWYHELSEHAATFDAAIVDCNANADTLAAFRPKTPVYAVAVSPAKVAHFTSILDRVECLFLNKAEAETLGTNLAKAPRLVKTLGPQGAELWEENTRVQAWPAPCQTPSHVNGLGDRLAGLILSQVLDGKSWPAAISSALAQLLDDWD